MSQFPSSLPFYSFLQYSPKGLGALSQASRRVRDAIKRDGYLDGVRIIDHATNRLAERIEEFPFLKEALNSDTVLVPVPGHAPIRAKDSGALWVPLRIAQSLVSKRFGAIVCPMLARKIAVQKAAFAEPGNRPTPADHFRSIEIDPKQRFDPPSSITVIDDFITRGSTMIGIDALLTAAFPHAAIHHFALARSMTNVEILDIIAPVKGAISFANDRLHREP